MDDSYVSVVNNDRSVVNKAAYVLFYKKRTTSSYIDTIPPSVARADESDNGSSYETAEESNSSLRNSFSEEDANTQQQRQQAEENTAQFSDQEQVEGNSRDTDNSYTAQPASPPDFNDFSGMDFTNDSTDDTSSNPDTNREKSQSPPQLDYTDMDDID